MAGLQKGVRSSRVLARRLPTATASARRFGSTLASDADHYKMRAGCTQVAGETKGIDQGGAERTDRWGRSKRDLCSVPGPKERDCPTMAS